MKFDDIKPGDVVNLKFPQVKIPLCTDSSQVSWIVRERHVFNYALVITKKKNKQNLTKTFEHVVLLLTDTNKLCWVYVRWIQKR